VILHVEDENRVRTLTLNRPDALNAFNEALYQVTAETLLRAAEDPDVAVVLLTGAGRAFSAGNDLKEMQARITDPAMAGQGSHFTTMIDALSRFPKPLICAVNGVGVGIGTTILGYADLAFMSSTARLKCPFTSLGVAPEAASSYLLPQLIGRQNAAWLTQPQGCRTTPRWGASRVSTKDHSLATAVEGSAASVLQLGSRLDDRPHCAPAAAAVQTRPASRCDLFRG